MSRKWLIRMWNDLSAQLNTIIALVVALLVRPLFPDAFPALAVDALPLLAGVRFDAVGGLAVFLILFFSYSAVVAMFRRQGARIARQNAADD